MDDFVTPDQVVLFGVSPVRIDAVKFDWAWANRIDVQMEGLTVPVLGKAELITNKRATSRPKDQIDANTLDG